MLTQSQLDDRRGLITSSVAAACLGLHPRMSPMQAKLAIKGLSEFEGNAATERGNELEGVVLSYPASKLSLAYEPAPFRRHANGWAGDSCDALYYERPYVSGFDAPVLIGEGKTAALGMAREFGEPGTDQVPVPAWVQAHWHLIHWPEVDRCVVPVLVGGWQFEFRLYYVARDTEVEGGMLERLAKWHRDYIVGDADPPVDGRDLEWLKETYSRNVGDDLLGSTPEVDAATLAYLQAKAELDACEERAANARAVIERYIGEHGGVETAHGKVTWRSNKPSQRIDWEGLARNATKQMDDDARNALIAGWTKTIPGARVLRAPRAKKEAT